MRISDERAAKLAEKIRKTIRDNEPKYQQARKEMEGPGDPGWGLSGDDMRMGQDAYESRMDRDIIRILKRF